MSRLSTKNAISFANILPVCLRALFVADWDINEERLSFEDRESMTREVKSLRSEHNFSTETAIRDVMQALRRHLDEEASDKLPGLHPEVRPLVCPALRALLRIASYYLLPLIPLSPAVT